MRKLLSILVIFLTSNVTYGITVDEIVRILNGSYIPIIMVLERSKYCPPSKSGVCEDAYPGYTDPGANKNGLFIVVTGVAGGELALDKYSKECIIDGNKVIVESDCPLILRGRFKFTISMKIYSEMYIYKKDFFYRDYYGTYGLVYPTGGFVSWYVVEKCDGTGLCNPNNPDYIRTSSTRDVSGYVFSKEVGLRIDARSMEGYKIYFEACIRNLGCTSESARIKVEPFCGDGYCENNIYENWTTCPQDCCVPDGEPCTSDTECCSGWCNPKKGVCESLSAYCGKDYDGDGALCDYTIGENCQNCPSDCGCSPGYECDINDPNSNQAGCCGGIGAECSQDKDCCQDLPDGTKLNCSNDPITSKGLCCPSDQVACGGSCVKPKPINSSCSYDCECQEGMICCSGTCLKDLGEPCNYSWECCSGYCDPSTKTCQKSLACGNKMCDKGECDTCPEDCTVRDCCGDGKCQKDVGENYDTCPDDCSPVCGNGVCEPGESYENCPEDCPNPTGGGGGGAVPGIPIEPPKCEPYCINETHLATNGTYVAGKCEYKIIKCGIRCEIDHCIEYGCNNNGKCEPGWGETPENCGDCYCGDGFCYKPYENAINCPQDCKGLSGIIPTTPKRAATLVAPPLAAGLMIFFFRREIFELIRLTLRKI